MEDQFEAFVRGARAGRRGGGRDRLAVIGVADAVYGPDREALMAADLSGAPLEHDLDPSRPPSSPRREVHRERPRRAGPTPTTRRT